MNQIKCSGRKLGVVLCGVLLSYTTYGQSVSVGVSVPVPSIQVTLPSVEIRAESDFYEPLGSHGEWVVVGSYGRCWRPARVARDWRPYCDGHWQRTDAGWYWVSDEPWAWATYHYGRWDFTDEYGWYWVPQTQWAPAWVSWHGGGGYVGWAPLHPTVSISVRGFVGFQPSRISSRAYVFVEQGRFLDPVRPTTVIVNNTTIINKTTTISNTKIVNNIVINEGPAARTIEKASGRKIESVPVQGLRQKHEATVVRQQAAAPTGEKKEKAAFSEVERREKKVAVAPEASPIEKPDVVSPQPAAPASGNRDAQTDKPQSAPADRDLKRETRPEAKPETKREARPEVKHEARPEAPAQSDGQPTEPKTNRKDETDRKKEKLVKP